MELARTGKLNTYVFRVELDQDEDGRWSASIPVLPGCGTWGATREEALEALKEASQAYIDVLLEDGRPIPTETGEAVHIIDTPAIAVTV